MVELKNKLLEDYVLCKCNKIKGPLLLEDILTIKSIDLNPISISNKYCDVSFEDLEYFRNLECLYISNMYIDLSALKYIFSLKSLKTLSLYECSIETLENIELLNLENLYIIKCTYNNASSINLLTTLKVLKIIGTDLYNINLENLKNLKELDVSNSNIKTLDYNFPCLEKLNISNTLININEILKIPKLKELQVDKDKLTQEIILYLENNKIEYHDQFYTPGDDL